MSAPYNLPLTCAPRQPTVGVRVCLGGVLLGGIKLTPPLSPGLCTCPPTFRNILFQLATTIGILVAQLINYWMQNYR